ncbi:MAG: N-6 DNA methylase [Chloroflexota bacterium]
MDALFHTNKQPADNQKLRGGYYTPAELARYLTNWAIRVGGERVLEPSCGDGNFVAAVAERVAELAHKLPPASVNVTAVEIEPRELERAKARLVRHEGTRMRVNWVGADFFAVYDELRMGDGYDVVLGNPPFIRFHYFADDSREQAFHHLREAGYKPTKLANAWSAFVQLSIELLREGGRLAMVLPAELLQVSYAGELRTRLAARFAHIVIVGFRKLVFPEIQQEVVLLLAEGKRESVAQESDIHTIEFEDGRSLIEAGDLNAAVAHVPSKHSRPGMKWTGLFLSEAAYSALVEAQAASCVKSLGQFAEVDVGVVTGRNSFFVLDEDLREKISASQLTLPVVGRTSALKSICFSEDDFERYKVAEPSFLLNLGNVQENQFSEELREYLSNGEGENVHKGYKCRVRKRWFDVPSIYIPDAFLFRQIHKFPLLVVNLAQVTSTDTIHRVRFKNGAKADWLAAACFNSLTLAWAEVCGRSYGGGVLELEPSEAERLPVPYGASIPIDVEKVDTLLRQGRDIEALDYVDGILLHDFMGLDSSAVRHIRCAWIELRDRRSNRRYPRRSSTSLRQASLDALLPLA